MSKITPRLRAILENGMSLWPTRSEDGKSIPGAKPIRRSFLQSFNWSLFWTKQTLHLKCRIRWSVREWIRIRRIRFVQFSIIRKHLMEDRVVTNYTRKRLSHGIQKEKNWSQDRVLGDPTSQRWRRGFYFIQLLLLSYLAGKKRKGQRSQIPKAFSRRVSRMLWSIWSKAARRSRKSEWRQSQNLKQSGG